MATSRTHSNRKRTKQSVRRTRRSSRSLRNTTSERRDSRNRRQSYNNRIERMFSIREMENNVNTYTIHHIPQKDISFHITLEELRPRDVDTGVALPIQRLHRQFIDLYKNRKWLSDQLQPCSQLCNDAKKYLSLLGPEETMLSFGATFWSMYFDPYLKPFRPYKTLNLFYIRNFNRAIDKIKHLNETAPFRINRLISGNRPNDILPIQYNRTSFNEQHTFSVETNKSTSNTRKRSTTDRLFHGYNPYITKNLYQLHTLIKQKYTFCKLDENAQAVLRTNLRLEIREYVLFQRLLNNIMIGYQLLEKNGSMLLVFENCMTEISKQLIYFLASCFKTIELANPIVRIIHSTHFVCVCKGFVGFDVHVFNQLIECDKCINKYNKSHGQYLYFKNDSFNKKLFQHDQADVPSGMTKDTHFVTNFIRYKKHAAIEKAIKQIVTKNFRITNEYLDLVNSGRMFEQDNLLLIKKRQIHISQYILRKYYDIDVGPSPETMLAHRKKPIRMYSFVHIPRTSGAGLKDKLFKASKNNRFNKYRFASTQRLVYFETPQNIHIVQSNFHNTVHQYPINSIKFAIVRHPYTRFRSAFNYLYEGGKHGHFFKNSQVLWKQFFVKHRIRKPLDIFNANDWVKTKILSNEFFKPQHTFVCNEYYDTVVDYLFRFEQLENVYTFLNQQLDTQLNSTTIVNTTETKIDLTPREKEYIYQIYETDFKLFGYTP